jgi:hypothetical protein
MFDVIAREDDDPSILEVVRGAFKIPNRYLRKKFILRERPGTKELVQDEWAQERQDD